MQFNDKQTDQWCASIKLQLQSIIASILIQSNVKSNCRYKTDWQWRSKSVSQPPLRVQTLYIIIMEKHCSHSQSQFSVRFLFFFSIWKCIFIYSFQYNMWTWSIVGQWILYFVSTFIYKILFIYYFGKKTKHVDVNAAFIFIII